MNHITPNKTSEKSFKIYYKFNWLETFTLNSFYILYDLKT